MSRLSSTVRLFIVAALLACASAGPKRGKKAKQQAPEKLEKKEPPKVEAETIRLVTTPDGEAAVVPPSPPSDALSEANRPAWAAALEVSEAVLDDVLALPEDERVEWVKAREKKMAAKRAAEAMSQQSWEKDGEAQEAKALKHQKERQAQRERERKAAAKAHEKEVAEARRRKEAEDAEAAAESERNRRKKGGESGAGAPPQDVYA